MSPQFWRLEVLKSSINIPTKMATFPPGLLLVFPQPACVDRGSNRSCKHTVLLAQEPPHCASIEALRGLTSSSLSL